MVGRVFSGEHDLGLVLAGAATTKGSRWRTLFDGRYTLSITDANYGTGKITCSLAEKGAEQGASKGTQGEAEYPSWISRLLPGYPSSHS